MNDNKIVSEQDFCKQLLTKDVSPFTKFVTV